MLAFYSCLGVIVVFAIFAGLGALVSCVASRMKRPRRPELALAIGNLGAPGGLTRSVVLSLGAGLSLLVTVALVDRSVIAELTERLPDNSPNYFILDLKREEIDAFHKLVRREVPEARIEQAPMLRGRIMQVGTTAGRASQSRARGAMGAQWRSRPQLCGDGSGRVKAGRRTVVAGRLCRRTAGVVGSGDRQRAWPQARRYHYRQCAWPQRHGPRRQPARGEVGEPIAQLRAGLFAQHAKRGAASSAGDRHLAEGGAARREAKLAQLIGRAFPASTAIRVKDAIDAFGVIFARVMVAVRSAGSVTLVAGALVLAGRWRRRSGAVCSRQPSSRRWGPRAAASCCHTSSNMAFWPSLTSFIAFLIGTVAAWLAVTQVMDLDFTFSLRAALEAMLLASVLVAALRRLWHLAGPEGADHSLSAGGLAALVPARKVTHFQVGICGAGPCKRGVASP